MAEKTLTAAEERETLIRQKMATGNMTRENAELVLDSQKAADAAREKKTKRTSVKETGKEGDAGASKEGGKAS